MAMRVDDCARCELHSPSHPITVAASGDDAIVTVRATDATVGDSLVVVARDPQPSPRVVTHGDAERGYVHARVPVSLAAGAVPPAGAPRPARRWVVLDDVSASRDELALRAQAAIVDRVLGEVDEQDTISVLAFDTAPREVLAPTRAVDVDRVAVRKHLRERERGGVGATDLGRALDRAVELLAGAAPADAFVVYLGDGVVTGGERGLAPLRQRLVGKATFVGLGVGDGVELPTLASLADATGGLATTIDLADDVGFRAYDAVAALYTERIVGLGVVALDGAGAPAAGASAYVRAGQLAAGEELEVVAAAPRGVTIATLRVTGVRAGTPWQLDVPVPPTVATTVAAPAPAPSAGDERGGYLPRLWAARHIGALMLAKTAPLPPDTCQSAQGPGVPRRAGAARRARRGPAQGDRGARQAALPAVAAHLAAGARERRDVRAVRRGQGGRRHLAAVRGARDHPGEDRGAVDQAAGRGHAGAAAASALVPRPWRRERLGRPSTSVGRVVRLLAGGRYRRSRPRGHRHRQRTGHWHRDGIWHRQRSRRGRWWHRPAQGGCGGGADGAVGPRVRERHRAAGWTGRTPAHGHQRRRRGPGGHDHPVARHDGPRRRAAPTREPISPIGLRAGGTSWPTLAAWSRASCVRSRGPGSATRPRCSTAAIRC
jgi:hypothetical protein